MITIKHLKKENLEEAAKVIVSAFNAVGEMWNFETSLARLSSEYSEDFCLGAFEEEKLVGIMIGKKDHVLDHVELYIDFLAVLPDYQGKGIGKLLLEASEEICRKHAFTKMWLCASPKLASYDMYLRGGFKDENWHALGKKV